MVNKRKFYIGLVIILTIITVGVIASMRINETNTEIYDKLDTNIRCGHIKVGEYPTFYVQNSQSRNTNLFTRCRSHKIGSRCV